MVPLDIPRTALLAIDMQRDFLHWNGYAAQAGLDVARMRGAIGPIRRLLDTAREVGMLVVHTREGHRPDLSDCWPAKLERSRVAGAEIGSPGPLGRLLVRGEYGHDFIDELAPASGEIVIDKPGYSAFVNTDLHERLRARAIDTLILSGVSTEVCVSSTLRSAVDLGYLCITVRDACASGFTDLHDAALRMIGVEGGIFGGLTTSDRILRALVPESAAG